MSQKSLIFGERYSNQGPGIPRHVPIKDVVIICFSKTKDLTRLRRSEVIPSFEVYHIACRFSDLLATSPERHATPSNKARIRRWLFLVITPCADDETHDEMAVASFPVTSVTGLYTRYSDRSATC